MDALFQGKSQPSMDDVSRGTRVPLFEETTELVNNWKKKGSYWRVTSQPPSITKKGSQQEVTIELTENSSGE